WTIMNSYNRINGSYASEHKEALNDILRDEWGFDGYVMTDWGACADPVKSVEAGMDLCMPGPANGNKEQIKDAVINGRLSVEILDRVVERILNIVFRYAENKTGKSYDFEAGHAQARIAAEGSAVLLKNANRALPLNNNEKVVFIGEYAKNPRYQGGGSSHIHPYRVVGALEAASDKEIVYCQGYLEAQNNKAADEKLLEEAVAAAKTADKVVIFAGLPESFESEGLDRKDIDMPQNQNALIRAVADVQPNTIVVLHNGSPVAMPWRDSVAAIMEMYLGGEAVGEATVNLLYGRCNPCGHLPETFPLRIEDTPAYPYYGVERDDVIYREGVMVGYRFYETVKREVAFPFGTGLSYSDFAYTNLTVDKSEIEDTDTVKVSVDVTNTSSISGKAVVQLYVAAPVSRVVRPVRELRGFEKVELTAGETKTVVFELNKRAFAYWNVNIHDWYVPSGRYEIQIGTSAHDIVAAAFVKIHCTAADKPFFTVNTPLGDIMAHPVGAQVFKQILDAMGNNIGTDGEEQEQSGGMLSQEAMDVSAAAMPPRALLSFVPELRIEQIQQMIDAINAAIG
ncbi:MAG: glycoside hydrolase family 3 C-terminal domain-containing protein, partial [Lachnospiraceae bacterium]|nr:glycoside hydrolase family 3 C-terminal domain-containing protein [Lachnospiraceae bacterium]